MFDITVYGARGDANTLNTTAIQSAIDACEAAGGGTVAIPAGVFISGSLVLKSNITLLLQSGAVLKGSSNIDDYPPTEFKHIGFGYVRCLIWAIRQENIRITGEGIIDLNHAPFMDFSTAYAGPKESLDDLSPAQINEAPVQPLQRPTMPLFFHYCRRIRVDGIKLINSPCWTITASCSEDIKIDSVTIENHMRVPNNDCLHFCGSKDIIVQGCVFSSADDCIAITGITDGSKIAERISITNCTMRARSSGIRLGHLDSKVRDVVISNITMQDCNRGLCIFAGDDGWVENVRISNIVMQTKLYAGGWWGKGEPLVLCAHGKTGHICNVVIRDVTARCENAVTLVGCGQNVEGVQLLDWNVEMRRGTNRPPYGKYLDLAPCRDDVSLPDDSRKHIPWLFAKDIAGLEIRNCHAVRARDEDVRFDISPCMDSVHNCDVMESVPA